MILDCLSVLALSAFVLNLSTICFSFPWGCSLPLSYQYIWERHAAGVGCTCMHLWEWWPQFVHTRMGMNTLMCTSAYEHNCAYVYMHAWACIGVTALMQIHMLYMRYLCVHACVGTCAQWHLYVWASLRLMCNIGVMALMYTYTRGNMAYIHVRAYVCRHIWAWWRLFVHTCVAVITLMPTLMRKRDSVYVHIHMWPWKRSCVHTSLGMIVLMRSCTCRVIAVRCTHTGASQWCMCMNVCTCWRTCLHTHEGVIPPMCAHRHGSDCTCMYTHVLTCPRLRAHACACMFTHVSVWSRLYIHTRAGVIANVHIKCRHHCTDVCLLVLA